MSERHFQNPFPNYNGEDCLRKLPDGSITIFQNEAMSQHIKQLFQYWEKNFGQVLSSNKCNDTSVYTGIAGAIMLYLKLQDSKLFQQHELEEYLAYSYKLTQSTIARLRDKDVPTFMCGDIGMLTVAALLCNKIGQKDLCENYLKRVALFGNSLVVERTNIPDEILYGRAGYLYSLLLIRSEIEESGTIITEQLIRSVVQAIFQSGIQTASKSKSYPKPLAYFWHKSSYLGAAHGYAGIAYILLEARAYMSENELRTLVKPMIDFVCQLQFPDTGNFPPCIGENDDRLVHWCHGSPGVIHLLVLAFKTFEESRYLDMARKAVDDIWNRGLLKKGYGLCHGSAGNAYAFIRMFQLTNEQQYLYRAIKFAEWSGEQYGTHGCRIADRPYSLFEGLAGTIYFLLDLQRPLEARFPAFQLST